MLVGGPICLFFIDDSGNTGARLDSVEQPVLWLVAIGLSPSQVKTAESRMVGLAFKYFPRRALSPTFEFHGSEIFGGRGIFSSLSSAERVALYRELLAIVRDLEIAVWVRGIDKQKHQSRADAKGYTPDHPYQLAFMYLAESLDKWLEGQQTTDDPFSSDVQPVYGLIVADEQREMQSELVEKLVIWRQFQTEHGYRVREIRYLIDTIHYVPSCNSWLIQLVDCVAFIANRTARIRRQKGYSDTEYTDSDKAVVALWKDFCIPTLIESRKWPT